MADTITMKVSMDLYKEIKKENEETKVPMIYILEKAWQEYKKTKGE